MDGRAGPGAQPGGRLPADRQLCLPAGNFPQY